MSFFKKIRGGFEKLANEMYKRGMEQTRADKLLQELLVHLQKRGINGTVHVSENMWESMGGALIGNVAGYIKLEGQNIDTLQFEILQDQINQGHFDDVHHQQSYMLCYLHYVVYSNVERLERRLEAKVKPIKKGFLSREIVDFRWEGGELAQRLNNDSDLRDMMLREGLKQLSNLEVKAHEKPRKTPGIGKPPKAFFEAQSRFNQCVRITKRPSPNHRSQMSIGIEGFSLGMQEPQRADVEFPTLETFKIYNRIAHHIRSITSS